MNELKRLDGGVNQTKISITFLKLLAKSDFRNFGSIRLGKNKGLPFKVSIEEVWNFFYVSKHVATQTCLNLDQGSILIKKGM